MINFLIRLITWFTPTIEGDNMQWLERDYSLMGEKYREFICGSCRGIYQVKDGAFEILAVQNTKKNKDFDRVLVYFDTSCKRDGMNLSFLSVGNPKLKSKLESLGFTGNSDKMTKIYGEKSP